MTAKARTETDVILATPTDFEIDGIPVTVQRIKSRELLALIGIFTRGLGPGISNIRFSGDDDALTEQFVGLLLIAMPNAMDEFVDFVQVLVRAKDGSRQAEVSEALENPDIDVLIDVLTVMAEQEAEDIGTLLGKARAALARIQSVYQTPRKTSTKGGRSR